MTHIHFIIGTLNVHGLVPSEFRIAEITGGIAERSNADAPVLAGFTKVLADGTHLPAGSSLTNHVAVIDHSTGLMWSVESLGSTEDANDGMTQEACEARCRELTLLGTNDWRLPTRAELAALIDDTRHEPAIDTSLFPRVKPRWHWTSTPCAWSSASAWLVDFSGGLVGYDPRSRCGIALAVRRAGQ